MTSRRVLPARLDPRSALVVELAWAILDTFTTMKAATDRMTAEAGQSTARFSVLQEIAVKGPRSVADIARARRAARQGVQRLAQELVSDGLIDFVPNPGNRRSPHLKLTAAGTRVITALLAEQDATARRIAPKLQPREVRKAITVLRQFGKLVNDRW